MLRYITAVRGTLIKSIERTVKIWYNRKSNCKGEMV